MSEEREVFLAKVKKNPELNKLYEEMMETVPEEDQEKFIEALRLFSSTLINTTMSTVFGLL